MPFTTDGPGYFSTSGASETYTLFDISPGNYPRLGRDSVPIWTDLGSGTSFGAHIATAANAGGTIIAIVLNDDGLAAIQAALGGSFALGGAITTLNGIADDEYLFGYSGLANQARLAITVPEPATGALLALGLGGLAIRTRGRLA